MPGLPADSFAMLSENPAHTTDEYTAERSDRISVDQFAFEFALRQIKSCGALSAYLA